MNFCTKCSSYYQTPRTCNCFVPQGTVPYTPRPAPTWPRPYEAPFIVPSTGTPAQTEIVWWSDNTCVRVEPQF